MKTLKCDICEFTAEGETFETWMEALKPHYAADHLEFMMQKGSLSKEEQMAEMQNWMAENMARFEAAP